MRRTPIAHVIFPRPSALRPVPGFTWEAVRAHVQTDDLDVSVIVPVPARPLKRLHGRVRRLRGAQPWPADLEASIERLDPKPTIVRYVPVPRRSTEAATAAIATYLLAKKRAVRPCVIQGSFLDEGGYAASKIGRVLGIPSVAVAHGSDVRAARSDGSGRKHRALEALREATRVVAVSRELASQLAFLGQHAEVLPFTARASHFPLGAIREGGAEILFVGNVGKAKGVDVLLEALALMKDRIATLRLVGPSSKDVDVEREADRLGIRGRVFVDGELARAALVERYASSSCLALPSRSEGLPCVLVESLLVGRPVVATDVGGVRELVDEHVGAVVPVGDPHALAQALDDVLATNYDPIALRGRAEPFSWEATGPRLCDIIRSLL